MKFKSGFTIIELTIVVSMIMILAYMAIPRFTDLFRKTRENKTKNVLSVLRDNIEKYKENNGVYPLDLKMNDFLDKKYLDRQTFPKVILGKFHKQSNKIKIGKFEDDTGGWIYDPETGEIRINCDHLDTKGVKYSKW